MSPDEYDDDYITPGEHPGQVYLDAMEALEPESKRMDAERQARIARQRKEQAQQHRRAK